MAIDLRSDTFTKPSDAMLEYMLKAEVGDDVFGEDPTVKELEETAAAIFGMEAGLFCPSGTMTNQIAIKCHTQPGQEVICEETSHVYIFEGGGVAYNSGCQVRPIKGERGLITAAQIKEVINPDDIHKPVSSLVSLENTANRGGGACYEMDDLQQISNLCREKELKLHLDGARLFNAIISTGQETKDYGPLFDSISICLSKGLGAPVGSVLIGSQEYIKKARRIRKVMGGGMRQAGYLAAAGLFAFRHNIYRLEKDHHLARKIASALLKRNFTGRMMPVETNIVIFELKHGFDANELVENLKEYDVLCLPIGNNGIRMVTHYDIHPPQIQPLLDAIHNVEIGYSK